MAPGQPGTRTLRGAAPSGWVVLPHPASAKITASSSTRAIKGVGIGMGTHRGDGRAGVRDHTPGARAAEVGVATGGGVRDRARDGIG